MELEGNMETRSVVTIRAAVDNTGAPQWSTWSETRTFTTDADNVVLPPPPVKPGKGYGKGGKK